MYSICSHKQRDSSCNNSRTVISFGNLPSVVLHFNSEPSCSTPRRCWLSPGPPSRAVRARINTINNNGSATVQGCWVLIQWKETQSTGLRTATSTHARLSYNVNALPAFCPIKMPGHINQPERELASKA